MGHGLPPELVADLVDPESHDPLREATEAELAALRTAIERRAARRRDGQPVPTSFDGAFVGDGGRVAYLVVDGVPDFLVDERLEIDPPLGKA